MMIRCCKGTYRNSCGASLRPENVWALSLFGRARPITDRGVDSYRELAGLLARNYRVSFRPSPKRPTSSGVHPMQVCYSPTNRSAPRQSWLLEPCSHCSSGLELCLPSVATILRHLRRLARIHKTVKRLCSLQCAHSSLHEHRGSARASLRTSPATNRRPLLWHKAAELPSSCRHLGREPGSALPGVSTQATLQWVRSLVQCI
jgi:hypothetical protein